DVNNFIGQKVRVIITAGAPVNVPHLKLQARVREANDRAGKEPTCFSEWYGGAETGIAATTCEAGRLHFLNGAVFGEVVDESGLPVPDGQRGRVTLTAVRRGSRYLRYLVGDEATVRRSHCQCGRATPRLEAIQR